MLTGENIEFFVSVPEYWEKEDDLILGVANSEVTRFLSFSLTQNSLWD
jgi:hypothetical protein